MAEYRTRSGRILTDADVQALADEAEQGYDVSPLLEQRQKLVITRGVPASGKTTFARNWVALDPTHRARVNRDDLRAMAHDGKWLGQATERQITSARDALIRSLLAKGLSVISDDTNLPARTVRDLRRIATLAGVEFEVVDLTDVPFDTCVERDAARAARGERSVGANVIVDFHKRYIGNRGWPLPVPDEAEDAGEPEPYVPVPGALRAIMVDIDGTVALHGTRSPYDETRVHEDRPNDNIIDLVMSLGRMGYRIILCSGRSEACRAATEEWLSAQCLAYNELYMRPEGDRRKDAVVKLEIFDREIRPHYNVVAVFDDRQQVVDMWRSIGLTVLQVAPGDF